MTISTSQFVNPTPSVADRVPNTSFQAFYDVARVRGSMKMSSLENTQSQIEDSQHNDPQYDTNQADLQGQFFGHQ